MDAFPQDEKGDLTAFRIPHGDPIGLLCIHYLPENGCDAINWKFRLDVPRG
jgi:hypothetical protein